MILTDWIPLFARVPLLSALPPPASAPLSRQLSELSPSVRRTHSEYDAGDGSAGTSGKRPQHVDVKLARSRR